ncbi:RNA recognition motif domain-containing protein [Sporobolomyces salmoneus]|uniref:RNA recognition motif domain-containing protein n=1 Tax=Sporobolomyces salmoneus TaxID=183962 RepID=UPI00317C714C
MSTESAPIVQAIQATPELVGHKCFVGNLSFATKGTDLSEIFGKVGTVSDAQVIYRGSRSLGYGFVTFPSEEDATKAVSQLDKSEISGRQINVELAKPMPANGNGASAAARAPKRAAKKAAETAVTEQTAKEGVEGEEGQQGGEGGEGQPKKRKARKARKPRGPRAPRTDAETEEAGDAPEQSSSTNAVSDAADQLANVKLEDGAAPAPKARKPRARKPKRSNKAAASTERGEPAPQTTTTDGESAPAPAAAATRERKPRAPRRRGPPSGEPSKTLIFVGNLPFSVTNESLAATFEGCQVKSAVVVTRKFGQAAGRSKGFAFVDFESEQDQQKALNEYQGKELEGRALSLKVAIEADHQQQQQQNGEGETEQQGEQGENDEDKGDNEPEATIVAS